MTPVEAARVEADGTRADAKPNIVDRLCSSKAAERLMLARRTGVDESTVGSARRKSRGDAVEW